MRGEGLALQCLYFSPLLDGESITAERLPRFCHFVPVFQSPSRRGINYCRTPNWTTRLISFISVPFSTGNQLLLPALAPVLPLLRYFSPLLDGESITAEVRFT